MRLKIIFIFFITFLTLSFFASETYAAVGVNKQINFQGKLTNADGTNVADNTYSVVFTLYDASGAGTNLWSETQSVTTINGIFQVALGSVNQTLGAVNFNSDSMYLGIKVGADAEMAPRIRFSAVPYAFNADKLNGITATQSATGFTLQGGTSSLSRVAFTTTAGVLTLQPDLAAGLTLQSNGANALTLDTGGAAVVQIGATNATGITLGTVTTLAANKALIITGGAGNPVATTGTVWYDTTVNKFKIVENGVVKTICNTTDAGCGAGGGGGGSNWTLDALNGVLRPNNNTADFLIGGTSTGSAKFAFGGLNSGTPTATFSGDLIINNKPSTAVADMQKWTKLTSTAGTIGGNNTLIASISASVVYNGSLYVGTNKAGAAEVYRYLGNGSTWTQVSGTVGTIGGGATTAIDMVSSMIVYNGYLYIGTSKLNAAEIYRYDGGTSWTKVSAAAAGTIGVSTLIDGVTSMVVYNGKLYAGTLEGGLAELYRYDGGTTWTTMNTTRGTFIATNTAAVGAVSSMVSYGGSLYLGLKKTGDADVVRFNGTVGGFISINAVTATGSYLIDGAAVTAFNDVPAMSIYEGRLVIALAKVSATEVVMWNAPTGTTTDTWLRLNSASGTIATGGTASIDSVSSMAIYNGRLYIGTIEPNAAQIYRYENNKGAWTIVSQNTPGMIAGGGTGAIDSISTLIPYNQSLFAGTLEGTSAEGYSYSSSIDQSYALKFHAGTSQAGGEQNTNQNLAQIFFVASLSANLNNKAGNTGAFVFSHNIMTNNGSYDVAEDYPTRDDTLEAGDVVSIDPNERGFIKKSDGAYDYSVIGVYSQSPAMRLSQDAGEIDGGRAVPIALAGRVPVKVSIENGEIKAGDYLTSSSAFGVAMKAKKSGVVIGQAMEPYSGEGVGKILVYIKSTSYQGSIASNFANIDTSSQNSGEEILGALQSQSNGLTKLTGSSEIVTDRLVADLEIVSPKIVTDELIAKRIKVESIEGLDDVIARIRQLAETKQSMEIATPSAMARNDILLLNGLFVDGLATVSANLRVKNNTLIEGILNVVDTVMSKNLVINGLATFFGDTLFKGNVVFVGHAAFSKDMVGTAVIKKDSTSIEVKFAKEYDQVPGVNVTISLEATPELEQQVFANDLKYLVTNKTTKGFTILLNKPATTDIAFSWMALGVDGFSLSPTPMVGSSSPPGVLQQEEED